MFVSIVYLILLIFLTLSFIMPLNSVFDNNFVKKLHQPFILFIKLYLYLTRIIIIRKIKKKIQKIRKTI